MSSMRSRCACIVVLFATLVPTLSAAKKPLDHDAYDRWNRLSRQVLSNDGKWVIYTVTPGKGTAVTRLVEMNSGKEYQLLRSRNQAFSYDSKYVLYLQSPEPAKKTAAKTQAAKKTAKTSKTTPAKKTPTRSTAATTSLIIMELATGRKTTIPGVKSFAMPSKAAGWVVYLTGDQTKVEIEKAGKSKVKQVETIRKAKAGDQRKKKKSTTASKKKSTRSRTTVGAMALRNLTTGVELRVPKVSQYRFAENGKRLAYSVMATTSSRSGIFVLNTASFETKQIAVGKRKYSNLTFDKSSNNVAYFASGTSSKSEKQLFHWNASKKTAALVATPGRKGFAKDRKIATNSSCYFSETGSRLFFTTVKKPVKKPKSKSKSKPVQVDIWHWKDPYLQPMQLVRARIERLRSYLAVVHLKDGRTVQLANEEMPTVTVGGQRDADVAVGSSDLPYRMLISWDWPQYSDYYVIDVKTGRRQRVLRKAQIASGTLSPSGRHYAFYDSQRKLWRCIDLKTKKQRDLTKDIPHPLYDEIHDRPYPAAPYGTAGWLKDESAILVYDKYDIWKAPIDGKTTPTCVTEEQGRKHKLVFRRLKLDREERGIPANAELLLSTTNEKTKASGVYRDTLGKNAKPAKVVMKDEYFRILGKARNSKVVTLVRSTFQKYPDLWQSTTDLRSLRRITDVNPQQKEYLWGKAELVRWKANDGTPLEGILIKPENFDAKKKYPMMVYFYERMSDRLHRYYSPAPVRASINPSFYASRGYVVFIPDVVYKIGSPGESAVNCIVPGVQHVIGKGFINPKAVGTQGHSWGGYQTAYLVTRTNIFAAAESGAPVSNMTSAYGGIRWRTGMSRMFQYERTQSRIGGTLWNARKQYLENSPLFKADKIRTPLLILHNDKDGAVPWYQGIELFVALRRLSRPAWLINYNGEGHGISKMENRRDFTIRMQQFFDHYLKGAPAPVWMAKGVPALEKGKVTGLDLVQPKGRKKGRTVKAAKPMTSTKSER